MQIFYTIKDLQTYILSLKKEEKTIGFAPTMGALHKGHLSLIRRAKVENDSSVCSIFVNPTQFNQKEDLQKYPRTPEKDLAMLRKVDNDIVFLPSVEEIYPPTTDEQKEVTFDFGGLDALMEGRFRPGHFKGVAQVVKRLLDIVQPDRLYMGQKDFQQLTIVQNMLEQLDSKVELVNCPIVREKDGLAMSSRNVRLDKQLRQESILLYKTLQAAKTMINTHTPKEIKEIAMNNLQRAHFKAEYFEIVDTKTLQNIESFENGQQAIACTAVWVGKVRLIDNMILN